MRRIRAFAPSATQRSKVINADEQAASRIPSRRHERRLAHAGYPAGIKQKILASDLDETRKMGSRSRLLKFDPGVHTTAPFVHDHWEEVYLMSGDLIVGNDAQGKGGEPFAAPTYACRPPGVHHGPFKSENGCMLFEMHYYDESKK
jgi:hypothetical protein